MLNPYSGIQNDRDCTYSSGGRRSTSEAEADDIRQSYSNDPLRYALDEGYKARDLCGDRNV